MVYLVIGMHKSGTTLIARLLQEAGIDMVDYPAGGSYESDKYEREATKAINKQLLGDEDRFSVDLARPVSNVLDPGLLLEAKQHVRLLNETRDDWGFKDPRTCLCLTFWDKALGQFKAIFVHRHPKEVMANYLRSRKRYSTWQRVRLAISVLKAWYEYNRRAVEHIRRSASAHEYIVIDYTQLMLQPLEHTKRLEQFLGRQLDPGAITSNSFEPGLQLSLLYAVASAAAALSGKPTTVLHLRMKRMSRTQR